jgi:hypothetical protein
MQPSASSTACARSRATAAGARFYLKCDLANFFVALDKQRLRELLARKVREPFWMWLVDVILFHDPRADVELRSSRHRLRLVPPHKSLFNAPADTGLPIGNLSSQFFANVFLDAVDQFVKHQLRIQHYVRYVDDFILLHESPQVLNAALARIREFLSARLNARLNESKTVMQPLDRGVDCVGHVITPWSRTLRRKTLRTALYRLEDMPAAEIYAAGNSLLGLARQCSHGRNDQARLCRALLKRGPRRRRQLDKDFPKEKRDMNAAQRELEELRDRIMDLLKRESRAMHTGEIAGRLSALTHQVHTAMHVPLQRGVAWFHSSEGYSLPPADRNDAAADQERLC